MRETVTQPLEELVLDIIDRRGVTPKKLGGDFTTAGYRVISARSIRNRVVDLTADEERFVSEEIYQRWMKTPLQRGDVLLTSEAPLGEPAYVRDGDPWCVGQRLFALRPDPTKLDGRYLFYALQAEAVRHDLEARATGTTVLGIRQSELRRVGIPTPSVASQKAIAAILGALDDKIELNRRMSETLEQMARALFKAWVVDGVMSDDSTGWADVRLKDVLTLNYGRGLRKADRVAGDVPVYGSGGVFDYHNESLVDGPTIVVGRKGTVGSLYWVDGPSYPGDTVFYVESVYPLTYCFYLLETLGLGNMNTDAAVPGLNRENAYRLEVALPPENLLAAFDEVVSGFRERMRVAQHESQTVASVRDALLPKLISGELRVPDAERLVSEVA